MLFRSNESAYQLGHVPSNGIGENRKGICQVNTVGGVELPIEAFPGRFSLVLQHEAERCHVTKALCRISARITAIFLLGIDSNASIELDSVFIRFEQLIINYTLLISPNTEKKLRTMVIWFCGRC